MEAGGSKRGKKVRVQLVRPFASEKAQIENYSNFEQICFLFILSSAVFHEKSKPGWNWKTS